MMVEDKYQSLSSRERFELLDAASQQRGIAPSIPAGHRECATAEKT
jgi:hypothetical protein